MSQHLVYTTESTSDKQFTKVHLEADALEKSILGLNHGENYLFRLVVKTSSNTFQSNTLKVLATERPAKPTIVTSSY